MSTPPVISGTFVNHASVENTPLHVKLEVDEPLVVRVKPKIRGHIPSGLFNPVYTSGKPLIVDQLDGTKLAVGKINPESCEMTTVLDPSHPPRPLHLRGVEKIEVENKGLFSGLFSRIYSFASSLFMQITNAIKVRVGGQIKI